MHVAVTAATKLSEYVIHWGDFLTPTVPQTQAAGTRREPSTKHR